MFYRAESGITEKASRETGALTFFPEGRTYSPPTALLSNACRLVYCLRQSCALRGSVSVLRTETANLLVRLNTAIFTLR